MTVRGSRLEESVVTWGPVGRVIATLVVVWPLWFFLYAAGIFGLVGIVVWVGWALPPALRDIWQPARLPPTELSRLSDEMRLAAERQRPRPPAPPAPTPPRRW